MCCSGVTLIMSPFSQSSVQDWGEEVEEGAIYNVTLKRVQIQQAANKGARWLGVRRPLNSMHYQIYLKEILWRAMLGRSDCLVY